jgi:hypothetical protein
LERQRFAVRNLPVFPDRMNQFSKSELSVPERFPDAVFDSCLQDQSFFLRQAVDQYPLCLSTPIGPLADFPMPVSCKPGKPPVHRGVGEVILESLPAARCDVKLNGGAASTLLVSTSQNSQARYLTQQAL